MKGNEAVRKGVRRVHRVAVLQHRSVTAASVDAMLQTASKGSGATTNDLADRPSVHGTLMGVIFPAHT